MTRYARRVDDNHGEVVNAARQIGVGVHVTSSLGEFVDAITFFRGVIRLVEIKDGSKPPSRRKLTPAQIQLHELARVHGCTINVVTSVAEMLALHGAR